MRVARTVLLAAALIGAVVAPAFVIFDVIDTSLYILDEEMTQDEDLYLAADRASVAGVIDGDLVVATGSLTISGRVTGDVLVISQGRVHVTPDGVIDGSLRGVARDVTVDGAVGTDVAVTTISTTIAGDVGRDVLVISGAFNLTGSIGRDLRGRFISGTLNGSIGNDVDIAVQRLTIGDSFQLGGDLVYRSNSEADVPAEASIAGQVVRLPTEGTFVFSLWFTIARVMSILAFLVSGILLLWLFRHTGARASGLIRTRPWATLGIGVVVLLVAPLVIVLLVATVVGIPVAILLAVLYALGLLVSPVPAVTAFGDRVLSGRGGLFGAFVLGALVWRLGIEFIPFVGVALYLAGLAWGTGGWVLAAWEERKRVPAPEPLLPPAMAIADEQADATWEPPLPPDEESGS